MNPPLYPPHQPHYGQAEPHGGCVRPVMPTDRITRAFAPASIGNMAAGFDFLGAALAPVDGLPLGNTVAVQDAEQTSLAISGPYADRLPQDPNAPNLVLQAAEAFGQALASRGLRLPPMAFTLEAHLPPGSGLGSSASSIVATLQALQEHLGYPLGSQEVLLLAGQVEGARSGGVHLDNVAPAYLGGLKLVASATADLGADVRDLPWPEDLRFVVAYPGFELPTARSRGALPALVPVATAVAFARNAAALVEALSRQDRPALARALWDPLAEPYRADLVPGFHAAKAAALRAGALGSSLSGAGPSVFAVVDASCQDDVAEALQAALRDAGHDPRVWICALDRLGSRVI